MSWSINRNYTYDPYYPNVSLLLHGDGANGSTNIVDSSPSPKVVTAVGNAQISTAQSRFGGASIAFDGTGDYLRPTTDGSPFAMGSGDWTVEAWIYLQSISTSQVIVDTLALGSPTVVGIRLRLTSGRSLELWNYVSAVISGGSVPLQSWSHIAACRGAGTTRLFIDGTQVGSSFADLQAYTCAANRPVIGINGFDTETLGFNGYIDDLRITKGVARYTANFTPPTAPFIDTYYWPYDVDAARYINQVEAADGQALESGVRDAINAFVVGCKADGIWTAIKASCILAGARTLSGALVPLVGAAPMNNNFASGDYNRKTGLVGNGTTKYLDANRQPSADPQNSYHISIYLSSAATGNPDLYAGAGGDASGSTSLGIFSGQGFSRNRSSASTLHGSSAATGLFASSRSNSTNYTVRQSGTTTTITTASQSPQAIPTFIFAEYFAGVGGPPTNHSNGRIAFYSIGESLDLALLDSRVTTLINTLSIAIP